MNNNEQNNTNQTPSSITTTPANSRPSTPENQPLNPAYNGQVPNAPRIERPIAQPVNNLNGAGRNQL